MHRSRAPCSQILHSPDFGTRALNFALKAVVNALTLSFVFDNPRKAEGQ